MKQTQVDFERGYQKALEDIKKLKEKNPDRDMESIIVELDQMATPIFTSKGAKDTIEEWVKKDIRQYYQVDVALSKPLEIDYATDLGEELRQHEAESVVLYKTTAFQFAYEDIIDEFNFLKEAMK